MHGMRQPGLLLRAALVVAALLAVPQPALAADCSRTTVGHGTLPDLASGTYKGEPGGLYSGTNDPPAAYAEAGRRAASRIVPLDAQGAPSAGGRVVVLSIGMSNTTQEFSTFVMLAKQDARKADGVVIVDGAQGGQDARVWAKADAQPWSVVDQRLRSAGVTGAQVQAVWLKQAVAGPRGDFAATTKELADLLDAIVRIAAQRYPQLQQVFLSPRTYAGYATTTLNPEPYAFETAFADRMLILRSVAATNVRPWVGWGPYLWTDGTRDRPDGFVWACEDAAPDGTHPSRSGQQKVAQLLQTFFETSPFTGWYRVGGATSTAAPAASAAVPLAPAPGATAGAIPGSALVASADDALDGRALLFFVAAGLVLVISTVLLARIRKV